MPPKPKLLFITKLPPTVTGAALHSGHLLGGLASRGYGAYAIAPIAPTVPPAHRHCAVTQDIDIQWLEFVESDVNERNPSSMDALYHDARAVAAVLPAAIDRIRPDAIAVTFTHLLHGIPDLARAHGLPCVVISHSLVNPCFGGNFRDDIAALLLEEYCRADRVIAIADHVAESCRRDGCKDVACVPNGVDTERFRPGEPTPALRARLRIAEHDLVVLYASRMLTIKRPLQAIAAATRSLRQDPRLHFVFAGDGPVLPAVRAAACDSDGADRIHVLGTVDPSDMPDLYRLADMVLMPSETEALSLVYLEALSSGCVLLASDIPAAAGTIEDGETGFLFPVGDVAAMADLILRTAGDASLRHRVGRTARAWSLRRPCVDDNIATFAGLFDDVIAAYRR